MKQNINSDVMCVEHANAHYKQQKQNVDSVSILILSLVAERNENKRILFAN